MFARKYSQNYTIFFFGAKAPIELARLIDKVIKSSKSSEIARFCLIMVDGRW